MSASASLGRRAVSSSIPRSSSASSLSSLATGSKMDEKEAKLNDDPRWRKYAAAVERVLTSFESIQEWADFITFLARLLKTLQTFPHYQVIPHKLTMAKRLSQCLNPALPTGVHQRALDVYVYILTTIGSDHLRRDLPAWSSGLFPFFQYAATSVRPIILGIYEKFYLPLQDQLRPCTKAFILALLPGVEEEGGEFFDKVASLLDQLSGAVTPTLFLQNLWLILITSPFSRIPALNYLLRRMPSVGRDDSIVGIVGSDVGLMIRAIAASLEDTQVLVQRSALDLLVQTLRLDGKAFVNDTRADDRVLIMRSALAVVLRRDLSLNRRLFIWLLGPSEVEQEQITYLRQNGLSIVMHALRSDLYRPLSPKSPTHRLDRQRPFKIFTSLLDKWEIGSLLTENLVLDAFTALQNTLRPDDVHDELLMTANTLFEALDPYLLWQALFRATEREMALPEDQSTSAFDLIVYIVDNFRLHDDEMLRLHLPILAFSLIDRVHDGLRSGSLPLPRACQALRTASRLIEEMPLSWYAGVSIEANAALGFTTAHQLALSFYAASDVRQIAMPPSDFPARLRDRGLSILLAVIQSNWQTTPSGSVVVDAAHGIALLAESDDVQNAASINIDWQPEQWLSQAVAQLDAYPATLEGFTALNALVSTTVTLCRLRSQPQLVISTRSSAQAFIVRLLDWLQPDCVPLFAQASKLIWAVDEAAGCKHVESPGDNLFTPLLVVLDSLRDEDLSIRRAAEAWMRCSLKSYIRVLDPLLLRLHDPSIKRVKADVTLGNQTVLSLQKYSEPFDHANLCHLLENLLGLMRFGGQGFSRIAKSTHLKPGASVEMRERLFAAGIQDNTYLDGITISVIRTLASDHGAYATPSLVETNLRTHGLCADILQLLISRGDLSVRLLQAIETVLVARLMICVHRSELDIQNRLLHVLHSTIQALTPGGKPHGVTANDLSPAAASTEALKTTLASPQLDRADPAEHDPLLIRLICDGINMQRSSAVLHHWIDFLLMTVSQLRYSLDEMILPLCDCITRRLGQIVKDLAVAWDPDTAGTSIAFEATDGDFTVLMNALERLLLVASEEASKVAATSPVDVEIDDKHVISDQPASSIFSYVTNVLSSTEHAVPTEMPHQAKKHAMDRLDNAIGVMLLTWKVTSELEAKVAGDSLRGQAWIGTRIKARTKKALERIARGYQGQVLEMHISTWHEAIDRQEPGSWLLDLLNSLITSPTMLISAVCERVTARTSPLPSDKSRSLQAFSKLTEADLFAFLEECIKYMSSTAATSVLQQLITFTRDFSNNVATYKLQLYPSLRCFVALCDKLSGTASLEDRKARKDVQDLLAKCIEVVTQLTGKVGSAARKQGDEHISASVEDLENGRSASVSWTTTGVSPYQLQVYLTERVLPCLKTIQMDSDRCSSLAATIVHYSVAPDLRLKGRTLEVEETTIALFTELTRLPAAAKAWRAQLSDIYGDIRFFTQRARAADAWRPSMAALLAADKEKFVDLLVKVTAAQSANIFANREQESYARAISLRRLSYLFYAGQPDQFLAQLPLLQEKLVDMLRPGTGEIVHAEVFTCLRVLLCRVGSQHLTSFWPVVLAELLRLFESLLHNRHADSTDFVLLIASACKLLDQLLLLQTEDFQIHQWMFVTDTVDAIYPPDGWQPRSIMDRLADIVRDRHRKNDGKVGAESPALSKRPEFDRNDSIPSGLPNGHSIDVSVPAELTDAARTRLKRPLLAKLRLKRPEEHANTERSTAAANLLAKLELRFFSRVSLASYETVYAGGEIDWDAVEASLAGDLFEGR
ncbi:hypothetical protein E5Q_05284 [Mixia osmundae IAM 14324]|uniref:Uncharacterized protein n=1 Tax=Mixia osmundae (strain CBS 9802 / IAM 14324 / JCM 22182 / KY 12970) TaxID=764103 RepID=G7E6Y7_MIXOS|nr:hypothetical protein E5Q_05284 [Mixia osmundae IAM 14324]